ncbi:MAG: hypothetical protein LBU65_15340 [Planctomycetaceae bacterium]|jgi:hypothetical protein|nr:hypothetical protein [Planctomycetaceae bacterium]
MKHQPSHSPLRAIVQPLQTRLDDVLKELQSIHQTLKDQSANKQVRRTSTVNDFVGALLSKFPVRTWTSDSLAKEVGNGCTGAAVRKTEQWKAYQEHRKADKEQHRKRSDIVFDNHEEIDARIDRETRK